MAKNKEKPEYKRLVTKQATIPKRRRTQYEVNLPEVRHQYNANTVKVMVRIPAFLQERWGQLKAEGLRRTYGDVCSRALNFALFGPHPYDDPVDGLEDAFRVYMETFHTKEEIVADVLRYIAKENGLDLKHLPEPKNYDS